MKMLLWFALTIITINTAASQPKKFLRIFDLSGKKTGKGYFSTATDTSIKLMKDSALVEYGISHISLIKTKRSGGHAVLISSAIGAVAFGALAIIAITSDDFFDETSAGEAFTMGFLVGAGGGSVIGGIISAANKRMTYIINGDITKWRQVRQAIEK